MLHVIHSSTAIDLDFYLGDVSRFVRTFLARHYRVRDPLILVVPSHVEGDDILDLGWPNLIYQNARPVAGSGA